MRKPIHLNPCASSSAFRPAGRTTSSAASSRNGCRRSSASRSTSRTRAASPATSRPKRSCARRPTATRVLLCGPANAISGSLYPNLPFNFLRDIVPVAGVTREPLVMVVHPSVPAKTVPEFLAYAKANAGAIKMASTGSRQLAACHRRTVQADGRARASGRALRRRRAGAEGDDRRRSADDVRADVGLDRAGAERQACARSR